MAKNWINPRDVKPQTGGTLFLIGSYEGSASPEGWPTYRCVFMRVRVVMGQMNVEDVEKVAAMARDLTERQVPFISFSAGRDLPYPEYKGDAEELMRNTRDNQRLFTSH